MPQPPTGLATPPAPPALSLHAFLTRLIWLCVGPLGLLAVYLAIDRVRDVQAGRDREARALATTLAADVDQVLYARIGALKMLAQSPLVDDAARWSELYQEAQGFRQSFGGHVVLADLGMQMRFNTRVPYGSALPKLPVPKGRAAVPIALASGNPAVGDTFLGPLANERLVAVAVPALRAGGKPAAVLLTVFEARQVQVQLDQVALPSGWSLAVRDGGGETIAHRAPPGFNRDTDVDASGRFVVRSAASAWSVELDIPRGIYRAPLLEAAAALALAVLAATLAGVVGGTLAGRRLARSVASLAQPPAAGGEPPAIAEIATARRLLDEAAHRRETAEATLLVSEQRFRGLFYESPLPQALIARDGVLVGLNARFVQVFGYSLDDVPTLAEWWRRAYPDLMYRATVIEGWNAAVARANATVIDIEPIERQVTCKDGSVRTMVVSGIGIGDDFLSTFFDVTERKAAEAALRENSALYQHTLESMLEGCQLIGFDWRYLYLNPAAARQHRVPAPSMIGRTVLQVYPDIEATPVYAMLRRCMEQRTPQHSEIEFTFPDGSSAWFDLNVQAAPEGVAVFSVDITLAKQRDTELKRLLAEQAERETLMRDLTARLRTLREEECTRISRQVHDELGQLLTGLKMDVRWMIRKLAAGGAPDELAPKLAEAEALVDQTVVSVQRIAVELRPSVLDTLGLPAAIRDEAHRFETRAGVASVVETGISSLPDAAVATALFRILQELLTNIARHAQATSLHIALADEAGAWVLRVRDNGVGIPVETARRATSLGLLGMAERAEAIGGTFRVERHPDGGTLATVRVPQPQALDARTGHAAHPDRR